MLKNYFLVAWRHLLKSKMYSIINLAGLATGMAVAMLIGLWIHDELSYNKSLPNYDRIGKLWQFVKFEKVKSSYDVMPIPIAEELRSHYPDFKYVSLSSGEGTMVLGAGDKKITATGSYVQPDLTEMLSLTMLSGSRRAVKDMNSILLSATMAKTLFGEADALNKVVTIDNKMTVKVAGVYKDFPSNNSFQHINVLASWDLYAANNDNAKNSTTVWDNNSWNVYVQLKESSDFANVSAKIKDIRMKRDNPPGYKPEFFVFPMHRWHLYGDFYDGVNTGGLITFVWLFGIIGGVVLLLACINFMNLSTARSEKRAKEVGIRKAIGSVRRQLVVQFFSESLLVTALAFGLALLLATLALPLFNTVAEKKMSLPWSSLRFWGMGLGFSLLTGLIAGSYPALYLSSFQPVRVLKGTFKAGRSAAIPRKVLVTVQFTVSVVLIIGTMVVFRQIQYARDRPLGYAQRGLIEVGINTPELVTHARAIRTDLLQSGVVVDVSASSCPMTMQYGGTTNIDWKGKDQSQKPLLMGNDVTYEFGRTVGWQVMQGRDFSRAFATDSMAMILNEAAVKLMGFRQPVGETVGQNGKSYTVVGIVKDMIREDPFQPVKPAFYRLNPRNVNTLQVKLSPQIATREALDKVSGVFHRYNPAAPFDYRFVDLSYGEKFGQEERTGKLAGVFTVLAIFISCLGLFGLASFVAEQRTKEIGVRKVLGASVFMLWRLLSKEFVVLVVIALFIAMPISWYFMNKWLWNYAYHADLSWWIFAVAGVGALAITLLTVSFQAVKAAMSNPVKSLRSE